MRGSFIVLEGLDGAGTTTQQRHLERVLASSGIPHWTTFEPTAGPIGELLRRALDGDIKLADDTLGLLFAADRQEHCSGEGGVESHLDSGKHVICDRYVLSSLAYQTVGRIDVEWLSQVNRHVLPVDVTLFIDTPPDVAFERILERGGKIEDRFQHPYELQRVFDNYRRLISVGADFIGNLVVVDGTQSPECVASEVLKALEPYLGVKLDSETGAS